MQASTKSSSASARSNDPAVTAVHQLQEEFPDHAIRIIECPELLGANGKVSNLVQMLPHARHPYILINDSDIVVSPHYLTNIMAGFAPTPAHKRTVGMVTAPYRGRAHGKPRKEPTLGSRMEALGISTDFFPGVLTARRIEGGIHFGLGSTLAVSRDALRHIGGLAPLVDYLADDYELGARIAAAGFDVELSAEVVETWVPPYDAAGFLEHQLRWYRSTRDSRRWGYTGLIFTFGLPWAFCNLIATGLSLEGIALFVLALAGAHRARAGRRRRHPRRHPGPARSPPAPAPRSHRPRPLGLELRRRHRHLARRTLPAQTRQTDPHPAEARPFHLGRKNQSRYERSGIRGSSKSAISSLVGAWNISTHSKSASRSIGGFSLPLRSQPLKQDISRRTQIMQLNRSAKRSRAEPQSIPLRPRPCAPFDDDGEPPRQQLLGKLPLQRLHLRTHVFPMKIDRKSIQPVVGRKANRLQLAFQCLGKRGLPRTRQATHENQSAGSLHEGIIRRGS